MVIVIDEQTNEVIVINSLFLALSAVFVGLRLYVRKFLDLGQSPPQKQAPKQLKLNDWLIVAALLLQVVQCIIGNTNAAYGSFNVPQVPDPGGKFLYVNKLSFAGAVLWNFPMLSIKLSVLDLYNQIFVVGKLHKAFMLMMGVVIAHFLICFFTTLFTCSPMPKNWDPNVPGQCMDSRMRMIVTAAINLIIDIVIAALPMKGVLHLQIDFRKKLALCLIFGIGILFCVTPALRIYYASQTNSADQLSYFITTSLEPDLDIVFACLPLTIRLVRKGKSQQTGTPRSSATSTGRSEKTTSINYHGVVAETASPPPPIPNGFINEKIEQAAI